MHLFVGKEPIKVNQEDLKQPNIVLSMQPDAMESEVVVNTRYSTTYTLHALGLMPNKFVCFFSFAQHLPMKSCKPFETVFAVQMRELRDKPGWRLLQLIPSKRKETKKGSEIVFPSGSA